MKKQVDDDDKHCWVNSMGIASVALGDRYNAGWK